MFLGVKDELTKAKHSLGLLAINYEYFNERQREAENEKIFVNFIWLSTLQTPIKN